MKSFLILSLKVMVFIIVLYFLIGFLDVLFYGDPIARALFLFTTKVTIIHIAIFSFLFSGFWSMIAFKGKQA